MSDLKLPPGGAEELRRDELRRRQLTALECAAVIGGIIGGLQAAATSDAIAEALQFWLDHRDKWPPSPLQLPARRN
jgi:hypothetical protein